jgi:hypothetical protein
MNRGLDIDIRSNIKEITKYLDRTQRKQVPYATMLALRWCAFDVRDGLVKHTQRKFSNRKRWYAPKSPVGLRVDKPTKKSLLASVWTTWAPAAKHEDGGVRTPFRGKRLLIPTDRVAKSRRGPGGAGQYLSNPKVFSTPRGVFRRAGGKRSPRVELLYWKARRAVIKPTYGWARVAQRIVNTKIAKQFDRALAKALATAK